MYKSMFFWIVATVVACKASENAEMCEFCEVAIIKEKKREYFECTRNQTDCPEELLATAKNIKIDNVGIKRTEYHMFALTEDLDQPTWRMYSIVYDGNDIPERLIEPAGTTLDPSVLTCVSCTKIFLEKPHNGYYIWKCADIGKEGCPNAFTTGKVNFDYDIDDVKRLVDEYCYILPGEAETDFVPFCTYQ
ncbi:uncharacterized protein LOC144434641 isoform X2 [Glandiceps talaboti]